MEKQLSFVLKLPLREIVRRSIAVALWNEADILALFEKLPFKLFPDYKAESEWQETVENRIQDKISKLALDKSSQEEIMRLVRPIGSEILRWKIFHEKFLGMLHQDFDTHVMKLLFWTSAGTIDYRKTAEILTRFEMLDIVKRYKLACLYCLEDEISTIWKEFPEKSKKCFCKGEVPLQAQEPQLEFCWAYILQTEESKLDCASERRFGNPASFCQNAFETFAVKGNQAAVEYFFQKLTCEERKTSLIRTAKAVILNRDVGSLGPLKEFPKEKLCDVLCYLLFLMTPEQQMGFFKEYPFEILRGFIDWPRHDYLPAISDIVFSFPVEDRYECYYDLLFPEIFPPVCYRTELFQNFFPLSSTEFKKYFVDRECESNIFLFRLLFASKENAKVIFRNVDPEDRMRLATSHDFLQFVELTILEESTDWTELCLREATLSKEERLRLKEAYSKFFISSQFCLDDDFRASHEKAMFEIVDKLDADHPIEGNSDDETHPGAEI